MLRQYQDQDREEIMADERVAIPQSFKDAVSYTHLTLPTILRV